MNVVLERTETDRTTAWTLTPLDPTTGTPVRARRTVGPTVVFGTPAIRDAFALIEALDAAGYTTDRNLLGNTAGRSVLVAIALTDGLDGVLAAITHHQRSAIAWTTPNTVTVTLRTTRPPIPTRDRVWAVRTREHTRVATALLSGDLAGLLDWYQREHGFAATDFYRDQTAISVTASPTGATVFTQAGVTWQPNLADRLDCITKVTRGATTQALTVLAST